MILSVRSPSVGGGGHGTRNERTVHGCYQEEGHQEGDEEGPRQEGAGEEEAGQEEEVTPAVGALPIVEGPRRSRRVPAGSWSDLRVLSSSRRGRWGCSPARGARRRGR